MKQLRKRLREGDVIFGQMVLELFTSGIGPMLAASGMDFVLYDMEHGRCDITLLAEMVASCRGSNIVPMARVPDFGFRPLSRVLDVGVRGVMVPRVETRAQAEEIVAQLKYAPLGRRGVALGVAHDLYQAGGAEFFAEANEETVVILLLETVKAFENLDEIVLRTRSCANAAPTGQNFLVQLAHHRQRPNWLIGVCNDCFQQMLIMLQHLPDGPGVK